MNILYIDPGTGSMLISATVALVSVSFYMFKGILYRKFGLSGTKGEYVNPLEDRDIVVYSEGKQYWNVFKYIVEGCSEEGIEISYFTSDKADPGLQCELPFVEAKYVGSGREAFYILNRLKSRIVILTTPGLDVLEIKRSKNAKFYIHITHATGSLADYKAFGVDYYDALLIGGKGDIEIIRELEKMRGLPKKEIKIVGHTYLDVLREKANDITSSDLYFSNGKPTVLVSPTWGMYSLLTNIGDDLLSNLEHQDDYNVIIRPHPQSYISDKELVDYLMSKYPNNEYRVWDKDTDNIFAMYNSDIMISDYSGIVFDYYNLFKKPILTMHSLFKKNGLDAMDLKNDPWNISVLDNIGQVITPKDTSRITKIISNTLESDRFKSNSDPTIDELMSMYEGESKLRAMEYIKDTMSNLSDVQPIVMNNETNVPYNKTSSKIIGFLSSMFSTSLVFALLSKLLSSDLLPDGRIVDLFVQLTKPTLILSLLILAFLIGWVFIIDKGKISYYKEAEMISITETSLVLLPLLPIVQYVLANQDILSISDSLRILVLFFLVATIVILVIPYILSVFISGKMLRSMLVAVLFTVNNMANYGSDTRYLHITLIMLLIMLILYLLMSFKKDSVIVVIAIALFTSSSLFSVYNNLSLNHTRGNDTNKDKEFREYIDNNTVINTPNIYLLVYDAYANQETYQSYGFDNSKQMDYLLEQNFTIYDGTYSIGYTSLKSMAHVIQTTEKVMTTIDERNIVSGNNTTMYFMNKTGYDTEVVFRDDYMFKGHTSMYSNTFPTPENAILPFNIIMNAILEGEFRNDASFSDIKYYDYVEIKNEALAKGNEKPRFFYTHDDLPGHSSFYRDFEDHEFELRLNNVKIANEDMKRNIDNIKKHDDNAIIVLLGDHGPYISNGGINLNNFVDKDLNRLDMQDRFGTFLAIHWPDESNASKVELGIIQDVMPAIFSYIYEDDELFYSLRFDNITLETDWFSGIGIKDGIIQGGSDDGNSLFINNNIRYRNQSSR